MWPLLILDFNILTWQVCLTLTFKYKSYSKTFINHYLGGAVGIAPSFGSKGCWFESTSNRSLEHMRDAKNPASKFVWCMVQRICTPSMVTWDKKNPATYKDCNENALCVRSPICSQAQVHELKIHINQILQSYIADHISSCALTIEKTTGFWTLWKCLLCVSVCLCIMPSCIHAFCLPVCACISGLHVCLPV